MKYIAALLLLLFLSWAGRAHMPQCLLVKGAKTSFYIKLFWLVADLLNTFKHWTLTTKCPCRVQAAPTAQKEVSGKGFGSVSFLPCSQEPDPGSWLWAAGTAGGMADEGSPTLRSSCCLLPCSAGHSPADAPPKGLAMLLPSPNAARALHSARTQCPFPSPRGVGREEIFGVRGGVQRLVGQRPQREVRWGINNGFCSGEKEFLNVGKNCSST